MFYLCTLFNHLSSFLKIAILSAEFLTLRPWQTRTHCCGHIVADTNVSPFARARNICCGHKFCVWDTKNVSDFVQKHFVCATNVAQFAQPKKHHGQHYAAIICPRLPGPLIRPGLKPRLDLLSSLPQKVSIYEQVGLEE